MNQTMNKTEIKTSEELEDYIYQKMVDYGYIKPFSHWVNLFKSEEDR